MASDSVQLIKDRLNIIDVVSPYVELQKSGRHFVARCPFHSEKTPSFHVSAERGTFHCFGCSVGGDIFTFTEMINGVDFKEALKLLAEKAGVELIPENPQKKSEREQLHTALEEATRYFENKLTASSDAQVYLDSRAVTAETVKKWRIGYAPGPPEAGWRELRQHLNSQGIKDDIIFKAGLIKGAETGREPFDVFRDRIMFPLRDQNSKVVGFSGRILTKDSEAPKYVNSPETELYHKSDLLYGYDMAKHGVRSLGFWLIVEGQFDVIMSHQAGYNNTVAVSGTALTTHHIQLLERLSNKVVLALDADKAGITAMKKASELMLRRGFDVKVVSLPEGSDPADIIMSDPKAYKQSVGNSVHVIEFLLSYLRKNISDDRTFKLRAREEIIPFITLIPNHIDREHFEGKIAITLGTTKDAVHFEVTRIEEEKKHTFVAKPNILSKPITKNQTSRATTRKESTLIYLLTAISVLKDPIKTILKRELKTITGSSDTELNQSIPEQTLQKIAFELDTNYEKISDLMLYEELAHKLEQLRRLSLDEQLLVIRTKLGEQPDANDSLMKELLNLQKQKQLPSYGPDLFIAE